MRISDWSSDVCSSDLVPRSTYGEVILADGDQLEIVHFVGGGDHPSPAPDADSWTVAGKTFHSRLIVGTGKYKSIEQNAQALEASGAEIIRSEEHTSELQSLMRISYAVF